MRVYIASLADYVAGILHGEWVDVENPDVDEINEAIAKILKTSPTPGAEEFAIHDYELPHGIQIGEYMSIEELVDLVERINTFNENTEHMGEDVQAEIVAHYGDSDDALSVTGGWPLDSDHFEEIYHDSLKNLPDFIKRNIDWDSIISEIASETETIEVDGVTWELVLG